MGAALLPHTTWHATKIMSWTGHARQFQVRTLCPLVGDRLIVLLASCQLPALACWLLAARIMFRSQGHDGGQRRQAGSCSLSLILILQFIMDPSWGCLHALARKTVTRRIPQ